MMNAEEKRTDVQIDPVVNAESSDSEGEWKEIPIDCEAENDLGDFPESGETSMGENNDAPVRKTVVRLVLSLCSFIPIVLSWVWIGISVKKMVNAVFTAGVGFFLLLMAILEASALAFDLMTFFALIGVAFGIAAICGTMHIEKGRTKIVLSILSWIAVVAYGLIAMYAIATLISING
jgi:hypothetical protein